MSHSPEQVIALFREAGGLFRIPPTEFIERVSRVQALVFDWDGVFNDGYKQPGQGSPFGEADSMGLNMLRFGLWLANGRLPIVAVITGEQNETALDFAAREHLHCVYRGVPDKRTALEDLCGRFGLRPEQLAVHFDDVNDLPMARSGGLRLQIRRSAGVLFQDYTARQGLCDYLTASPGGGHAVREVCELLLGVLGRFDEALGERTERTPRYREYFAERQAIETSFLRVEEGVIVPV